MHVTRTQIWLLGKSNANDTNRPFPLIEGRVAANWKGCSSGSSDVELQRSVTRSKAIVAEDVRRGVQGDCYQVRGARGGHGTLRPASLLMAGALPVSLAPSAGVLLRPGRSVTRVTVRARRRTSFTKMSNSALGSGSTRLPAFDGKTTNRLFSLTDGELRKPRASTFAAVKVVLAGSRVSARRHGERGRARPGRPRRRRREEIPTGGMFSRTFQRGRRASAVKQITPEARE